MSGFSARVANRLHQSCADTFGIIDPTVIIGLLSFIWTTWKSCKSGNASPFATAPEPESADQDLVHYLDSHHDGVEYDHGLQLHMQRSVRHYMREQGRNVRLPVARDMGIQLMDEVRQTPLEVVEGFAAENE